MRLYRMIFVTGILSLTSVALVSCSEKPVVQHYPYGPLSQTGVIVTADISLVRRGTHVLRIANVDTYYLESKTENLDEYTDQSVQVDGILEPNTQAKYLPVLLVSRVSTLQTHSTLHEWKIPSLGIALATPDTWQASIKNDSVVFTLPDSASGETLLKITQNSGALLPQGESILIAGAQGIRVADARSGLQDVYMVDATSKTIRFHFTPNASISSDAVALEKLLLDFDGVIQLVRIFSNASTTTNSTMTGSNTDGAPCGGQAGILCPATQYCDVFDTESMIGKCKSL